MHTVQISTKHGDENAKSIAHGPHGNVCQGRHGCPLFVLIRNTCCPCKMLESKIAFPSYIVTIFLVPEFEGHCMLAFACAFQHSGPEGRAWFVLYCYESVQGACILLALHQSSQQSTRASVCCEDVPSHARAYVSRTFHARAPIADVAWFFPRCNSMLNSIVLFRVLIALPRGCLPCMRWPMDGMPWRCPLTRGFL